MALALLFVALALWFMALDYVALLTSLLTAQLRKTNIKQFLIVITF